MSRAAVALLLVAACGGAQRHGGGGGGANAFRCGGRHAAYVVTGGITAAEAGIKMTCAGDVPSVEVYRVLDGGKEERRSGRISAEAWDSIWKDFENGGWRMVEDCKNLAAAKRDKKNKDPFYVFEIADDDKQISVSCKGKELPFPHDTFREALDRAKSELPVDEKAD